MASGGPKAEGRLEPRAMAAIMREGYACSSEAVLETVTGSEAVCG